jgi:hypothetical protein
LGNRGIFYAIRARNDGRGKIFILPNNIK